MMINSKRPPITFNSPLGPIDFRITLCDATVHAGLARRQLQNARQQLFGFFVISLLAECCREADKNVGVCRIASEGLGQKRDRSIALVVAPCLAGYFRQSFGLEPVHSLGMIRLLWF